MNEPHGQNDILLMGEPRENTGIQGTKNFGCIQKSYKQKTEKVH